MTHLKKIVAAGILGLVAAIQLRKEIVGERLLRLSGVLSIVFVTGLLAFGAAWLLPASTIPIRPTSPTSSRLWCDRVFVPGMSSLVIPIGRQRRRGDVRGAASALKPLAARRAS